MSAQAAGEPEIPATPAPGAAQRHPALHALRIALAAVLSVALIALFAFVAIAYVAPHWVAVSFVAYTLLGALIAGSGGFAVLAAQSRPRPYAEAVIAAVQTAYNAKGRSFLSRALDATRTYGAFALDVFNTMEKWPVGLIYAYRTGRTLKGGGVAQGVSAISLTQFVLHSSIYGAVFMVGEFALGD
jgi:hypothetical protein